MTSRYILAPEAARDLIDILRYIENRSSLETANQVEAVIRNKFSFLAKNPGAGHQRKDLTQETVKFFPVYSYLVVYRPDTQPLQIVAVLHGHRDAKTNLQQRRPSSFI
jgi:toxin ParE1/3/4